MTASNMSDTCYSQTQNQVLGIYAYMKQEYTCFDKFPTKRSYNFEYPTHQSQSIIHTHTQQIKNRYVSSEWIFCEAISRKIHTFRSCKSSVQLHCDSYNMPLIGQQNQLQYMLSFIPYFSYFFGRKYMNSSPSHHYIFAHKSGY